MCEIRTNKNQKLYYKWTLRTLNEINFRETFKGIYRGYFFNVFSLSMNLSTSFYILESDYFNEALFLND